MTLESHTYEQWPYYAAHTIAWLQSYSFPIWLSLGILSILGWLLRWRGDPWIWDKLQVLLDKFQEIAFSSYANHIKDHHRVTLFKYKKWHWRISTPMTKGTWPWTKDRLPWSGWLIPILRSGRTSQKTKAVFMAPDNGNLAEGVAGKAWVANNIIVAPNLPNLSSSSSDQQIARYAKRTTCPAPIVKDYVARGRDLPRSIGAIPIEVNNVPWGVLVLDSREEKGVTPELLNSYTLIVNSISQLLEKAK